MANFTKIDDGYLDFSEYKDEGKIEVQDESFLSVKFFKVMSIEDTKDITNYVKQDNIIALVDVMHFIDKPSDLRIIVNKIKRINGSAEIKLYGKNWLLITSENIEFIKGK